MDSHPECEFCAREREREILEAQELPDELRMRREAQIEGTYGPEPECHPECDRCLALVNFFEREYAVESRWVH